MPTQDENARQCVTELFQEIKKDTKIAELGEKSKREKQGREKDTSL